MLPEFLFCNRSKKSHRETGKNERSSIEDQKIAYFEKFSAFKFYSCVIVCINILLFFDWLIQKPFKKDHGFPEVDWSIQNMLLAPLLTILLIVLLFLKYSPYSLYVNTATAIAFMRVVISLEQLFHRRECLISYVIMIVIFRLMDRKTIYDNFGLCVAYTSDIVSINRKQYDWFYLSNLFVWIYFGVALLILFVFRRLAFRIWEHIRVLVILREKCNQEKQLGNHIIGSNMSEDMITHLFPLKNPRNIMNRNSRVPLRSAPVNPTSASNAPIVNRTISNSSVNSIASNVSGLTDVSVGSRQQQLGANIQRDETEAPKRESVPLQGLRLRKAPNGRMFIKHSTQRTSQPISRRYSGRSDEERSTRSGMSMTASLQGQSGSKGTSDAVLRPAVKAKVIDPFLDAKLTLSQLESIGGMDRREVVLVAFKPDLSGFDHAFGQLQFHAFIELVDYLAIHYKMTRIRTFGNIWIGCLGVFNTHESTAVDCQKAVMFASEVASVSGEFFGNVTYAVEFGRILCGFVNSASFDVFGQEIRWILMMLDLKEYGKIALGDAAKKQLHQYRKQVLESNAHNAAMERKTMNMNDVKIATLEPIEKVQPWTVDSKITVNYITNIWEMINESEVKAAVGYYYNHYRHKANKSSGEDSLVPPRASNLLPVTTTVARPRPLPFGLVYNPRPHLNLDIGEVLLNLVYDNILPRLKEYFQFTGPSENIVVKEQTLMDWFKLQNVLYGDENFLNILKAANPILSSSKSFNLTFRSPIIPRAYLGIEDRMSKQKRVRKYGLKRENAEKDVGRHRLWKLYNNSFGLGVEFLTTVEERYGVALDDSVLEEMTESELETAHNEIEAEVYRIVENICFRLATNTVFMVNHYTDVYGRNEYITVRGKFIRAVDRIISGCRLLWSSVCFVVSYLLHGPTTQESQNLYFEIPMRQPISSGSDPIEPDSGSVLHSFRSKPSPQVSVSFRNSNKIAPESEQEEKEKELDFVQGTSSRKPSARNISAAQVARQQAQTRFDDRYAVLYSHYKSFIRSDTVKNMMVCFGIEYHPDDEVRTDEEEDMRRSWLKYSGDIRMFNHSWCVNSLISVILTGAALYSVKSQAFEDASDGFWVFLLGGIHLILPMIVDRQYDRLLYTGLLGMCFFVYIFFPAFFLCENHQYDYGSSKTILYFGDLGGDVTVLLITAIRIAAYARHSAWQTIFDWILFRNFMVKDRCDLSSSGVWMFFLFNLQIVMLFQLIEHRAFVSYIVEHKMVAYAHKSYLEQMANTRRILQIFNPGVPLSDDFKDDLFVPRVYHNCLIVAIHIKAPDILSSIIDPAELVVIMKTINEVIDDCIIDCGMLKVTQFSGICVAVACKDFKWDGLGAMRHTESYKRRGMALVKKLEEEVTRFNEKYEFNLAVGVGINHGSVSLGLHGNHRHCFDVSGPAVDIACDMACYHGDKIFLRDFNSNPITSSVISSGLNEPQGDSAVDNVEDVSEQTTKDASVYKLSSGDWYPIGDNGMQGVGLHDFDHLKMLGKGGYGSVHLVEEKQTKEKYAIKVIPLNAGPIIPRMITRECIILQMMNNPNVVSLECAFTHKEKLYLVMQYIRGGTLKEVLEYGPDKGIIKMETKKLWFSELVLAIEYIHTMGIIHRDVKPANCMIGTDGHLRLADFGLSKKISDGDISLMNNAQNVNTEDLEHMAVRSRRQKQNNPIADSLGLTPESYFKIQKFLPLKLSKKPKGQLYRFLSISTDFRADVKLTFSEFRVEIVRAENINDVVSSIDSFDGICIEIDKAFAVNNIMPRKWDPTKEGLRLVQDFFAAVPRCANVFVVTKSQKRKSAFTNIGVKDFSTNSVHEWTEIQFRSALNLREGELPASETVVIENKSASVANVADARGSVPTSVRIPTRISNSKAHSAVGTMHFIAPEVLKMSAYGKPVDWWALGITIYECMVGEHVFLGEDRSGVVSQISSAGEVNLLKLKKGGDALYRLVQGLLQKDVKLRLGTTDVESIKSHEFFRGINWLTVFTTKPEYMPNTFEHPKNEGDEVLFRGDEKDSKTVVADYKQYYDTIDQDTQDLENNSGNQAVTRKQYARSNVTKYKHQKSRFKQHHRTKHQQSPRREHRNLFDAPSSAAKNARMVRNVQHNMSLTEEEFNRTREGMQASENPYKIDEENEKDVLEECSGDTGVGLAVGNGGDSHSLKISPKSGASHSDSMRLAGSAAVNALLESSMEMEDHLSENGDKENKGE